MTSQNEKQLAARRAAVRRVRLALEARIQEKLAYACGATVYQPLETNRPFTPYSMNREYGVNLQRETQANKPVQTKD